VRKDCLREFDKFTHNFVAPEELKFKRNRQFTAYFWHIFIKLCTNVVKFDPSVYPTQWTNPSQISCNEHTHRQWEAQWKREDL
jgi:hypothetical protein